MRVKCCACLTVNDGQRWHPSDLWQSVTWNRTALGSIPGSCAECTADCGHQNSARVCVACPPVSPWCEPGIGACAASCRGTSRWLRRAHYWPWAGADAALPRLPLADNSCTARSASAWSTVDQQACHTVSLTFFILLIVLKYQTTTTWTCVSRSSMLLDRQFFVLDRNNNTNFLCNFSDTTNCEWIKLKHLLCR